MVPTRIPSTGGHGPDQPEACRRNADGVVFYKVSNGRSRPKMPAFKDELTEEQIWSVVAYVQTLRKNNRGVVNCGRDVTGIA